MYGRCLLSGKGAIFLAVFCCVLVGKPNVASTQYENEVKLLARDGAASDRFGYTVGVDGDTAVVGVLTHHSGFGGVYIFERDEDGPDNWGIKKQLSANDVGAIGCTGAVTCSFGIQVALSGDTLLVAAPVTGTLGTAFVFRPEIGGGQLGQSGHAHCK